MDDLLEIFKFSGPESGCDYVRDISSSCFGLNTTAVRAISLSILSEGWYEKGLTQYASWKIRGRCDCIILLSDTVLNRRCALTCSFHILHYASTVTCEVNMKILASHHPHPLPHPHPAEPGDNSDRCLVGQTG